MLTRGMRYSVMTQNEALQTRVRNGVGEEKGAEGGRGRKSRMEGWGNGWERDARTCPCTRAHANTRTHATAVWRYDLDVVILVSNGFLHLFGGRNGRTAGRKCQLVGRDDPSWLWKRIANIKLMANQTTGCGVEFVYCKACTISIIVSEAGLSTRGFAGL